MPNRTCAARGRGAKFLRPRGWNLRGQPQAYHQCDVHTAKSQCCARKRALAPSTSVSAFSSPAPLFFLPSTRRLSSHAGSFPPESPFRPSFLPWFLSLLSHPTFIFFVRLLISSPAHPCHQLGLALSTVYHFKSFLCLPISLTAYFFSCASRRMSLVGIDLVWGWQFWIQVGPIICAGLAFAAIFVPFIIGAIYSALKKTNPSQITDQQPQPEDEKAAGHCRECHA
jgi:hypothetical protein